MRPLVAIAVLASACSDPAPGIDDVDDTQAMASSDGEAETGVYPGSDGPLIDLNLWQVAADDPFPDRPAQPECPQGFGIESGLFEVDTELCRYGAFVQPSLSPVRAGDEVEFIVVHDALYSEDPTAEAHLGIALGDEIGWETTIPIPSQPGFLRPVFVAASDAPAGTPVILHVHNHGVNNYRVVEVTVYWQ